MAYDFQAAVAAASAAINRTSSSESTKEYKYPLVYPAAGQTTVIRLLFNPASGQIARLVNRHEKVPCYRSYGIECPICKVQQQVKDLTGTDPFGRTKSSKARGISFAQFISSTAPIDKGGNKGNLQPGEIVLFMYPWSVYQQINQIIQSVAQTPTGMDQAFSHADSGLFLQVSVSNDFKYILTQVPYMTFATGKTDEQFAEMLDGMESLNDQVIPASITQEVDKQVKEYCDAIYNQYIVPRVPSQTPQSAPQSMTGGFVPNTTPAPTPAPQMGYQVPTNPYPNTPQSNPTQGAPACMGAHKEMDPQCICCPYEVQCIQSAELPFKM